MTATTPNTSDLAASAKRGEPGAAVSPQRWDSQRYHPGQTSRTTEVERILGLLVPVTVALAERHMPIEEILRITVGTIIEFEVPFDSELVLQVADRPVGRGQAVKVGENFGLRITHIGPIRDRIGAMGGR